MPDYQWDWAAETPGPLLVIIMRGPLDEMYTQGARGSLNPAALYVIVRHYDIKSKLFIFTLLVFLPLAPLKSTEPTQEASSILNASVARLFEYFYVLNTSWRYTATHRKRSDTDSCLGGP